MPYDGFVMRGTVEQIAKKIVGFNLRNVYLSKHILYFSFDNGDLKVSLNPNFSYISFVNHFVEDPEKNNFVEFLRSRIRGAKVVNFSNIQYERTAVLELKKIDEIGVVHNYALYFDIMGKHSNAIIVENSEILEAFKRVQTKFRNIFPGEKFVLYPSDKLTIDEIDSFDKLKSVFEGFYDKKKSLVEFIYTKFQGFSKVTAEEVLYRSELDNKSLSEVSLEDLKRVYEILISVKEELKEGTLRLYYEDEKPKDISVIRLHQYRDEKKCSDFVKCVNEYFEYVEVKDKIAEKRNQLLSVVKSKIDHYENLLSELERELEECKDADKYRKYGELIKAYSYQINCGEEMASLYDWESDSHVSVPLEKNLSPIENSVKYFNLYSKLKRKAKGIEERKEILSKELSYLQQLQLTIENAEGLEELFEIEDEMVENGLIKKKVDKKGKKKSEQVSEPRKYVYNGFTILVGKNNRQNDELVVRSSDNDIWLHVQGMPGAHVVIKTNGKSVDEDTLRYAARLAATYSKGRYSSNVPVDYTYIKYVKKVKGLKPGLVLYSNFKTLFVDPIER